MRAHETRWRGLRSSLAVCLCVLAWAAAPGAALGADAWTPQYADLPEVLEDVSFIDSTTGWAVGWDGSVRKTVNGGAIWTTQPSPTALDLKGVCFVDENTGWAVGGEHESQSIIAKTTDGGASWTVFIPSQDTVLYAVDFVDANVGWAVGTRGVILKTADGGDSWTPQASGTTGWLADVQFLSPTAGWAVGGGDSGGIVLKTVNGGATWTPQASASSYTLNGVHFVNATTGWAVGGTFAFGWSGSASVIRKTTDGGETWFWQDPGTAANLESVCFTDANSGWAVGENGTIIQTVDGGGTWTVQPSGTHSTLTSVCAPTATTGWIVGLWDILYCGPSLPPGPRPVWRFYNSQNGTHFYTASGPEMNNVRNTLYHTYTLEGAAYYVNSANSSNAAPLYRFFRPSAGTHFYTASQAEKDLVQATLAGTYQYEGPAYMVASAFEPDARTVYRFFKPSSGTHFYTASEAERDSVGNTLSHIFQYEGPAFSLGQ